MRVLLDAHMVGERQTGNETYVANLVRGLARINEADELYLATAHPEAVEPLIAGGRGARTVPVSSNPFRRLLYDLPALAARLEPDLVFSTYAGPMTFRCPIVVAVHDISFRRHPEWYSPRDRVVLRTGVGVTVRRAAAVLTLSEFSRRELATFYPVAAGRIHVVPTAPAPHFTPDERDDGEVLARYGIRKPYLLAVGNLEPRKNLARLVEAFSQLAASPGFAHDLVLVGQLRWQGSAVGALVQRAGLTERVKATGYVGAGDLPALYRGADVFVYPSLYEGFGLPVVEAMACGTPVVASNTSSIPEVAGAAARLVDPLSVEDLAKGIADLCAASDQRALWRRKGLAQSQTFTCERTARQTLEVLRGVASARSG